MKLTANERLNLLSTMSSDEVNRMFTSTVLITEDLKWLNRFIERARYGVAHDQTTLSSLKATPTPINEGEDLLAIPEELPRSVPKAERASNKQYSAGGKVHSYRFGSKASAAEIKRWVADVWGGVLRLSDVDFDGHYWRGSVGMTGSAESIPGVRLDYLVNYMRPPRALATDARVQKVLKALAETN